MSDMRIHLLGFGRLGRYLHEMITPSDHEVGMIYNRTLDRIDVSPPRGGVFDDLKSFAHNLPTADQRQLSIEASHPTVAAEVGSACLERGDLMITSLTALMDPDLFETLQSTAAQHGHTLFIPEGAGWGLHNIRKMNALGQLTRIEVDMYFSPSALRLSGDDDIRRNQYASSDMAAPVLIAQDEIQRLALRAPNNVNTMCALRLAADRLADDQVIGRLWADGSTHAHRVLIKTHGPDGFYTEVLRYNPAVPGAVTGQMTFSSFWSSVQAAVDYRRAGGNASVRFV